MTKKPLIAVAAVAAVAAPAGAFVAADATAQSGKAPRVSDLNVDLTSSNAVHVRVDASRARSVKLTYGGTTRTARLTDRDDDGGNEYTARFSRASGDSAGDRVRVKVTARGAGGTTTRTLSDRIDDDRGDDDGDDHAAKSSAAANANDAAGTSGSSGTSANRHDCADDRNGNHDRNDNHDDNDNDDHDGNGDD